MWGVATLLGVGLAIHTVSSAVTTTTRRMNVSLLEHGNVLPQYKWMCKTSGGEFDESGYCVVARTPNYVKKQPLHPPCQVSSDPECPDWVFDGLWQDSRTKTLPYTVQDVYHRDHTPTDVEVIKMSNDHVEATITPGWDGRLWSLYNKHTGKPLFYDSDVFQPTNDALRQAYIEGGSEWNFGPQIGHMSNTLEDAYVARLPTARGDVIRVWMLERVSGCVWQVDMFAGNGSVLYVHPKLTNPTNDTVQGYWWTNVGINVDSDGSDAVRILTPATHWISDSTTAARPPWPFFHERNLGLGAWSHTESSGDWTYPNYPELTVAGNKLSAVPVDHSYAFLWWEKRDVWYDLVESPQKIRYNGWVDAHGGNMIHGHPNNGTKAWIWGVSPVEQFWQDYGGGSGQNNLYTELQTGVMPTQYQGFPMLSGGTREWTEYFASMDLESRKPSSQSKRDGVSTPSDLLKTLHAHDYHGTVIPAVEDWLDSINLGSNKSSTYDDVDTFLESIADRTPTPTELLHSSAGWGAVEQLLRGTPLAPGAIFPVDPAALAADLDVAPWFDLVSTGTFSAKALSRHAISFQIAPRWVDALETSIATHGPTWLHHFHLGVALLETSEVPGDNAFTEAESRFAKSLVLKETAEAHRNLAIIAHARGEHQSAFEHYTTALQIVTKVDDADPEGAKLLVRDLAAESSYQFSLLAGVNPEWTNCSEALTAPGSLVPPTARYTDRFRFAAVQVAFTRQRWAEFFMLCDCAPERLWPAIGWWGGGTQMLLGWYEQAILLRATQMAKRPLTQVEQNGAIRANPIPFCLRAVGH
eukprot:m.59859 g.59859  ORF g.59859 m.59859 type:complete len:809 (+) comp17377_c0_seq1:82-2508(+)